MRWKGRRQSRHVEDRRGRSMRGGAVGGGVLGRLIFGLFRRGSGKMKLILIVGFILACVVFKKNPLELIQFFSGEGHQVERSTSVRPPDREMKAYLATMKADNEEVWQKILTQSGVKYRPAKLVIYEGRTRTPGGIANAGMGPFYLPANETIYIDPSFFRELKERFGAKGDFAEAYVVAHEVGHHVQKLLGNTARVHRQKGRVSDEEYNRLSVRLELQADFLAGVFAHHAQERFNFLEEGDIQEAMECAEAIGDDRLQKQAQGHVQPDLFTHGTSAQRRRWFMSGFESGDLRDGDTFDIPYGQL